MSLLKVNRADLWSKAHHPKKIAVKTILISVVLSLMFSASAFAQSPKGEIKPGPLVHTPESSLAVISGAQIGLPASLTQSAV